jgi:hypothetical protein
MKTGPNDGITTGPNDGYTIVWAIGTCFLFSFMFFGYQLMFLLIFRLYFVKFRKKKGVSTKTAQMTGKRP